MSELWPEKLELFPNIVIDYVRVPWCHVAIIFAWCGLQYYLIMTSPHLCWEAGGQAGAHYYNKARWGNEGKLRADSPGENMWDSEPCSPAGGDRDGGKSGGVEL